MTKIKKVMAREILDSRGNPTVEAKIILDDDRWVKAGAPSGASTGVHEAQELRDGDPKRYAGKGVLKAVANINGEINKALIGMDVTKQKEIDKTLIDLDGTENKSRLGANAIIAVSLACARAGALASNVELHSYISKSYGFGPKKLSMPIPAFNIFNGGKHADTNLDFQEFMVMPLKKKSMAEMVQMGSEIFHKLGEVLRKAGLDTDVGNEGGYAPDIDSSIQAIEYILTAAAEAGYIPGEDVGIATDVGSSELFDKKTKKYIFPLDNAYFINDTLSGLYGQWFNKYPIVSIEDGLAEDEWEAWAELTKDLGDKMMLVGDDLFCTNVARLRKGLKEKAANAIIIKPNQVGTLTETIECVKLAQKHNYKIMVSHRSGETCDPFIADLAVAVGAEYIKSGAPSRGERLAKYNRLLEIEAKF